MQVGPVTCTEVLVKYWKSIAHLLILLEVKQLSASVGKITPVKVMSLVVSNCHLFDYLQSKWPCPIVLEEGHQSDRAFLIFVEVWKDWAVLAEGRSKEKQKLDVWFVHFTSLNDESVVESVVSFLVGVELTKKFSIFDNNFFVHGVIWWSND